MKKWVIGSLVGAIIVFVWQFVSWSFLPVHNNSMKYTTNQDQIMAALNANLTEDGLYTMPSAPTKKGQQDMMKSMEGKPSASVIYHKSTDTGMTMRMIRGFLVDFFLVISLIYVLTRGGNPIPRRAFSGAVALGLFAFIWTDYTGHIWFDLPWHMIMGDLIDSIVAWGLCGIWVGWWLNRTVKAS
ncbi:MAG: hypothetical protein ACHQEB_06205 [Chitinophagales bacterium]